MNPGLPLGALTDTNAGISSSSRFAPSSWLTTLPKVGCTTVGLGTKVVCM